MPTREEIARLEEKAEAEDRVCARRRTEVCSREVALAEGKVALLYAQRAQRETAEGMVDALLAAIPEPTTDAGAWAAGLDALATGFMEIESYGLESRLRSRSLALWTAARGAESREVLAALLASGEAEYRMGRVRDERTLAANALALALQRTGPNSPLTADAQLLVGRSLMGLSNYSECLAHLNEALRIREALFGPRNPKCAEVRVVIGFAASVMRDGVAYREQFDTALEILDRPGVDPRELARALVTYGGVLTGTHDDPTNREHLPEARALLDRAHHVIADGAITAPLLLALTFGNLANIALRTEDVPKCMKLNEQALALFEASVGLDYAQATYVLSDLGLVLSGAGQHEAARSRELAAIAHFKNAGPSNWSSGTLLRALALVLAYGGDVPGARDAIQRALVIHTSRGMTVPPGLSEREALGWIVRSRMSLDSALDLLRESGDTTLLWDAAITWTGVIRAASERRHRIRLQTPDSQGNLEALRAKREEIATAILQEADASRLQRLVVERDQLDRALSSRAKSDLPTLTDLHLPEICAALAPDEALVQFVRYPSTGPYLQAPLGPKTTVISGFVAPPGHCDTPVRVNLGPAQPIEDAVDAWRSALDAARGTDGGESLRWPGAQLRALAWDPIAAVLGGARKVYLVPDGELALVPFGALPAPEGGYLLDTIGFSYLDSARDLAMWARVPLVPGEGALVVGDVDYGRGHGTQGASAGYRQATPCGDGRFTPLPGTRREMRDVTRQLRKMGSPVTLLRRAGADENRFAAQVQGKRVLHVATHGFFPDTDCHPDQQRLSPMSLSGLAFAGANLDAGHAPGDADGRLSAEEIAGLDLRSAALVVLSSCGSGLGPVRSGEGALGLRRAFAIAGARAQINTLSPVPDGASAALMDAFYRGLALGRSVPEALLQAQRAVLLRQRAAGKVQIDSWGTFVATGVWHEAFAYSPTPSTR